MHELSLAKGIVKTALDTPGVSRDNLKALSVEVGALSSVDRLSLEFCLLSLCEEMLSGDVSVNVSFVPARVVCECGHEYSPEGLFEPCPKCGGFEREIIAGKDTTLESVEVDDEKDKS